MATELYARLVGGSLSEYVDLDIETIPEHKRYLFRKVVDTQPTFDSSFEWLEGPVITITETELQRVWTKHASTLQTLKSAKIAEAAIERERRNEEARVIVPVDGVPYFWGCDRESRENIMGVVSAITAGIPIPNPRAWTPKGSTLPVACTHNDLKNIGAALLAKKDSLMQKYFLHKLAIAGLPDAASVQAYNVTQGWD